MYRFPAIPDPPLLKKRQPIYRFFPVQALSKSGRKLLLQALTGCVIEVF